VIDDQPPTVSFGKPGRDTSASPVEEVFTEVKAADDFGIKQLQMVYSVNGGPQKTIALFGGGKTLTEVSAGHTIYLEELGLQPGDFVSYFAKATDNDSVPGPHVERHLLRADPAVPQGLQGGAVAGGRRRRRRRTAGGRRALAPAARDRRCDVQHRP
jgi:hypothetical protein